MVRARADKKLMVNVSKQAIARLVTTALGLYRRPSDGPGGVAVSQQSSVDMPMGNLSMPGDEVPFDGASNSMHEGGRQGQHVSQPEPLDLGDWDFYESDLQDPEPIPVQKLSRQDMRKNYDATGELEHGPTTENAPGGGRGKGLGSDTRKPTPGAPSGQQPGDDSGQPGSGGMSRRQQKEAEHQRQQEEMKQLQQQQRERMRQDLPENLDYGEDVFEDDGDGEFEEEVARAQQISRSISRERPLSAPGSMSAPQSISSLPSRQAADTNDISRVDSIMEPAPYGGIDYIAEQSNETVSMRVQSGKSTKDDDARSDLPVPFEDDGVQEVYRWENPEEESLDGEVPATVGSGSIEENLAPSGETVNNNKSKLARSKTHTDEILDVAFSESQVASVDDDKSVRSEVSASLGNVVESIASEEAYTEDFQ